ncbi:ribonuclease Oy-like isoform X1 [Magallana gigas]|uniref:ribonuclease Oy-like isoform X1 n=2 Tax=Magallana gigas TaxID=29159 RepID=UPI00333EEA96
MIVWYAMRLGLSVAMLAGIRFQDFVEAEKFDFFTFSLQWPVTFCRVNKARCKMSSMPNFWTIHGLWPSNFTGANPRKCSDFFDVSHIPKDVITEMNEKWPNLIKNEPNEKFWSTQWKVHGSCAESVPGVQNISQYFTKAVKLAEMYNIKEILRSRNVTEGKNYTISSIQDAMKRNTTRLSKITWSKSKCARNWLYEIRICLDKQFGVINCPNVTKSTLILKYPNKDLQSPQALRCDPPSTGHSSGHLLSPFFFIAFLSFLSSIL